MRCQPRLLAQWHNALHLLQLVLGLLCAALIAPRVAVDDFLSNTEIIFAVLACLVALQAAVLAAYFHAHADLGKMVNLDQAQHFYLRCVISSVVGALYVCEGSFLLYGASVDADASPDADVGLELASGVAALVLGVVYLAEGVVSWRSVGRFDAVDASLSRLGVATLCPCCRATDDVQATPSVVVVDADVGGETNS